MKTVIKIITKVFKFIFSLFKAGKGGGYNHTDAALDAMSQTTGAPNSKGIISPLYYSNQQNRDHF